MPYKVITITLNPKDKNDKPGKMSCEVDCWQQKAALLSQAIRPSMIVAIKLIRSGINNKGITITLSPKGKNDKTGKNAFESSNTNQKRMVRQYIYYILQYGSPLGRQGS